MSQTSGVIQKKLIKAFPYGNRISFMIGHNWYSVFDNKLGTQEARDVVESLKEGDEVELEFTEKKSQDGQATFLTIVGITRVDRLDKVPPASPAATTQGDVPATVRPV